MIKEFKKVSVIDAFVLIISKEFSDNLGMLDASFKQFELLSQHDNAWENLIVIITKRDYN